MKQLYPIIAIVLAIGLLLGSVAWTIHTANSDICGLRARHEGPFLPEPDVVFD